MKQKLVDCNLNPCAARKHGSTEARKHGSTEARKHGSFSIISVLTLCLLTMNAMFNLTHAQSVTLASNSPLCAGQNLILTATVTGGACPSLTYTWVEPGGASSGPFGSNTFTYNTPVTAGVYTVNVLCNGVPLTPATTNVVVTPNPGAIQVALPQCTDMNPVITLSVTPQANVNYQWNLNGSPIGGANAFNYVIPNNVANAGNYTLTASNACGTVTTAIQNIPQSAFIFLITGGQLQATNFVLNSWGNTPTGLQFIFDGNFNFQCGQTPTNITFTGCTIYVKNGGQILVGGNATCAKKTLNLNQTTVTTCDSWNGIALVGNGVVSVANSHTVNVTNGSFIQNSSTDGINVTNCGALTINNSTMNDHATNHVHIIGDTGDPLQRAFIQGATFDGINQGGGFSILAEDVRVLQINGGISNPNQFTNLDEGIVLLTVTVPSGVVAHNISRSVFQNISTSAIIASNTLAASVNSIRITNCNFTNTSNDAFGFNPAMTISGYGTINITGNVTNFDPNFPDFPVSSPLLIDDGAGAGALTTLNIQNNTFNFRDNGIQIVNRTDGNVNIGPNTLNMYRYSLTDGLSPLESCIYFEGSVGLTQVVTENDIHIDGVTGETQFPGTQARGLYVNGDITSRMFYAGNKMTVIPGVQINSVFGLQYAPGLPLSDRLRVVPTTAGAINSFTNVHRGVWIDNTNLEADVVQNNIALNNYFLPGGATEMQGVYLENGARPYSIRENTVQGPGPIDINGNNLNTVYGIHIRQPLAGSPLADRTVTCNVVNDVNTALYFESGNQLPLVIARNQMSAAVAAPPNVEIWGIYANSTSIGQQGPVRRSNDNEWMNNGANFTFHLRGDNFAAGLFSLRFPGGNTFRPSPLLIGGSSPLTVQISLFNINPGICTGSGPGINFVGGGNPGGKGASEETMPEEYESVLQTFAKGKSAGGFYEAKRYDELSALYAAVVADAAATQDAPLAQVVFDSLVQSSNIPAFYDVENLILAGTPDENFGDNVQTNVSDPFANVDFSDEAALFALLNQPTPEPVKTYLLSENLQKAREILANISATNEIEKNLIIALNYTCKAHLGETLTDGERAELQALANQCLIPGGRGVAYARALWTWLTRKPAQYADDCVDTEAPGQRKGITEANPPAVSLRLYPNPARGAVTIDNLTPGTTLEVYDPKGAKVASYAIDSASLTVSTANLRGGMYLFRFLNGGNVIATEKVNILD